MSIPSAESTVWAWLVRRPAERYGFVGERHDFRPTLLPSDTGDAETMLRTAAELVWFDRTVSPIRFLAVPAGFVCDGASIPRWAWTAIGHPLSGRFLRAAVLHDYAYRHAGDGDTRATVDRRFYHGLRADGVGRTRAALMYTAVRVGGGAAWARGLAPDQASH